MNEILETIRQASVQIRLALFSLFFIFPFVSGVVLLFAAASFEESLFNVWTILIFSFLYFTSISFLMKLHNQRRGNHENAKAWERAPNYACAAGLILCLIIK